MREKIQEGGEKKERKKCKREESECEREREERERHPSRGPSMLYHDWPSALTLTKLTFGNKSILLCINVYVTYATLYIYL